MPRLRLGLLGFTLALAASLSLLAAPVAHARGGMMVVPGAKKAKGGDDKGGFVEEVKIPLSGGKTIRVPEMTKFEVAPSGIVVPGTEGKDGVNLTPIKSGETVLTITKKDGKKSRYKIIVEPYKKAEAAVAKDAGL